jgi:hypothetical protein
MLVQAVVCDNEVDLNALAGLLARTLGARPPLAKAVGKERIRWTIVLLLRCSREVADQLVDALIFRDQLRLCTDAAGEKVWRFGGPPARC